MNYKFIGNPLAPEFVEGLKEVVEAYKRALKSNDYEKSDEIIDSRLRPLLQKEHNYLVMLRDEGNFQYATQTPNAIFREFNSSPFNRELKDLGSRIKVLASLVFNEQKWREFSEQVKSRRNPGDLLQLAQNGY